MSKNSFWNSLGNAIGTIFFIKYLLPIIIVVVIILIGIALNHKEKVANHVDKDHSILYTEFKNSIYNIAKEEVNQEELELSISKSDIFDVELKYTVKNKDYSAEQYDNLIKQEMTKVYNKIKNKELVNDTLFGKDENLKNVKIGFTLNYSNDYYSWIGGEEIGYSLSDKWDSSYNRAMEKIIVSQENLNNLEKQYNYRKEQNA